VPVSQHSGACDGATLPAPASRCKSGLVDGRNAAPTRYSLDYSDRSASRRFPRIDSAPGITVVFLQLQPFFDRDSRPWPANRLAAEGSILALFQPCRWAPINVSGSDMEMSLR
jgi:hypothetical protein